MSTIGSKLNENRDLLGAVVGLFLLIFIWGFMYGWDENRNTLLSNNENFQLMLSLMILVPVFFYAFWMFIRGIFAVIWAVAAPTAE